jgi:class 3 adenylate cyclase
VSAVLAAQEARDSARLEQLAGGKVVIVAAILNYSDRLDLPTPLAAWEPDSTYLPGALFHAQAVRTLAADALLKPMTKGALLVIASTLALLWFCPGFMPKAVVALLAVSGAAAAGWFAPAHGHVAPAATLVAIAVMPLLLRLAWDVHTLSRERTFLGSVFRGSVSPRVLAGILSGKLDPNRRGGRVHVHVMFADIRGFTKLSENTEPERVIRILNAYLGEATQAVHGVNGTIDKFLGDGVLAVFGAPEPLTDSWDAAITAARDLIRRVRKLNAEHADYLVTPIELGIGIHAGDAIVGFVGSSERYEFTTIGDAVNVASRIQGLTAELGFPILASVDALPEGGRLPAGEGTPLGPQKIKGHTDIDVVGFKA